MGNYFWIKAINKAVWTLWTTPSNPESFTYRLKIVSFLSKGHFRLLYFRNTQLRFHGKPKNVFGIFAGKIGCVCTYFQSVSIKIKANKHNIGPCVPNWKLSRAVCCAYLSHIISPRRAECDQQTEPCQSQKYKFTLYYMLT